MTRVLVVATSRKTRGGITSVIKAHETGNQWKRFHCHWVQTHRDGPAWRKILYFSFGMVDFLTRVPFYDIVHIHTADYGTEKRKRIFAKITKFFKKKLIVHLHSSGPEFSIGGKHRELYRWSFTHADKILLLSKGWMEEAKKAFNIPNEKMEVLYNPCPLVSHSELSERKLYILFAGTLTHRKGYDDLIKAFASISERFPNWRLKLAGNGEIESAKNLAIQYKVDNKVDFLGWINGNDKDVAFRKASIYCLPSYSEGFPMGVLDAWAYNLPVVTTPVGGIPDVAIDGKNLLLFQPGDIEMLSLKLSALMSSEELRIKLSSQSKALASQVFNISQITIQLSSIYTNV